MFPLFSENLAALDPGSVHRLRGVVRETMQYFLKLPDNSEAANSAMPVVENLKIPTRGTVVIMLAFIVIIGPVNIIYLNRIKRRTWMLWTIPAISFATTLLVFMYSLLREGITPDVRIAGITVRRTLRRCRIRPQTDWWRGVLLSAHAQRRTAAF